MSFFESGACLIQLVDHLQQVGHAFSRSVVEPVSFLFVIDNETATGLIESTTYFLVQNPRHKEGNTFLRVFFRLDLDQGIACGRCTRCPREYTIQLS